MRSIDLDKIISEELELGKRCQPDFDFSACPIIIFCDSSWQDCVDTGRSTGAYHIYVNGSLVKSSRKNILPMDEYTTLGCNDRTNH